MANKLKPWHIASGITPKGAKIADFAVSVMTLAIEVCNGDVSFAYRVMDEAAYRCCVLPRRSKKFQARYKRDNF